MDTAIRVSPFPNRPDPDSDKFPLQPVPFLSHGIPPRSHPCKNGADGQASGLPYNDRMEKIIREILARITPEGTLDPRDVESILAARNKLEGAPVRRFAKKHIMPYYLKVKANDPVLWDSWAITPQQEAALFASCRMKPRRTSSGVATITVITKPWACSGNCLFCPNDVRMPKSYLSNEPACQRAERNFFDPYLQVASRLKALVDMGHETGKIELIVLGGTFCDYPESYQIWFVEQLFEALNDEDQRDVKAQKRRRAYQAAGIENDPDSLAARAAQLQGEINSGQLTYNQAAHRLYRQSDAWQQAENWQTAGMDSLFEQHARNEHARHRVVGLVVETRPDTVDPASLCTIRQLGCTKVQMGIQGIDPKVLAKNRRAATGNPEPANRQIEAAKQAIDLARLFGFKIHTHFMVNLLGSTPQSDKRDYASFMTRTEYQPDEVKIYPCSLVAGTGLQAAFERGEWVPYSEEQLIDVLAADVAATPEFTRISRMIRDISAQDILAGNKKGNLRQLVDDHLARTGQTFREIRSREINTDQADLDELQLEDVPYQTLHTTEHFLQWVTPARKIAGFLRLSLPDQAYVHSHPELAVSPGQAMIREVHVYGRVASIGKGAGQANAQHAGLGKKLIECACEIAREQGFSQINVISSVGTREYYRKQDFADAELYQVRDL